MITKVFFLIIVINNTGITTVPTPYSHVVDCNLAAMKVMEHNGYYETRAFCIEGER